MADSGPTLWSSALRACLSGFAALGLDADRVRRDAGVDAAQLADPDARVPFAIAAKVWPAAQAQWGQRGLGLHTGAAVPFGELGVLDYATVTAATLGEGLTSLVRAFRVVSHGASAFAYERDGAGSGELRFLGEVPPEVRDYSLAGVVGRLRLLGVEAEALRFAGPPLAEPEAYARLLGVAPRFGADNALRVAAKDLDADRGDSRYRGLRSIVGREVERLLAGIPTPDAATEARRVIARLLPAGTPTLGEVARAMAVSSRTLQRRLAAEGTTLRALVDDTRASLACAHLRADRLRIAEIAYLLGYTEPGTFTASFRRWRGVSPSEFRGGA